MSAANKKKGLDSRVKPDYDDGADVREYSPKTLVSLQKHLYFPTGLKPPLYSIHLT
jgi:hypothetical protein